MNSAKLTGGSERLNKTQYEKVRRDTQKTLIQNIGSLLPIAAGNNLDQITILRLTHAYLMDMKIQQPSECDERALSMVERPLADESLGFNLRAVQHKGDHVITSVSDGVTNLLGFHKMELIGYFLSDLVYGDSKDRKPIVADGFRGDFHVIVDLKSKISQQKNEFAACRVAITGKMVEHWSRLVYLEAKAHYWPLVSPKTSNLKIRTFQTLHALSGHFIKCDQSIALMTGYSVNEVLGQSPFNYVFGEDKLLLQMAVRRMLQWGVYNQQTGVYNQSTYRLVNKNGHHVFFRSEGQLIFDQTGAVQQYVCTNYMIEKEEGLEAIQNLSRSLGMVSMMQPQQNHRTDPQQSSSLSQYEPPISSSPHDVCHRAWLSLGDVNRNSEAYCPIDSFDPNMEDVADVSLDSIDPSIESLDDRTFQLLIDDNQTSRWL